MKRIILVLLCLSFCRATYSQECPLCGDWKGTYWGVVDYDKKDNEIYGNINIYIRVKENGDGLIFRVKRIYPDGRVDYSTDLEEKGYVVYFDSETPNKISWQKYILTEYENGRMKDNSCFYSRTDIYRVYSATANGGKLIFKDFIANKRMGELTHQPGEYFFAGWEREHEDTYTLYKDDDDW